MKRVSISLFFEKKGYLFYNGYVGVLGSDFEKSSRKSGMTDFVHVSPSTEDDGSSGFQKELSFDIGASTLNNPNSHLRPKLFL